MFAAGSFSFPTAAGDFSVTGVGFKPELVMMFGSNRPEEDVLVTGLTRPGLFYSYNCVDALNKSAVASFCISIAGSTDIAESLGFQRSKLPVRMQGTSATINDYRASAIRFDPDGFTLTVSQGAPGNRPVHWWAYAGTPVGETTTYGDVQITYPAYSDLEGTGMSYGDLAPGAQALGRVVDQSADATISFEAGFPIRSMMGLTSPAGTLGSEAQGNSDSWLHEGACHYPHTQTTLESPRKSLAAHTGSAPNTGFGDQGYSDVEAYDGVPANRMAMTLNGSAGAFTQGFWAASPDVLHGSQARFSTAGISTNAKAQAILIAAAVEGTSGLVSSPASVPVPAWFDAWELVQFVTINGNPAITPNAELSFGIGVLHPDYQGCVVFGRDGSFFQSRSKMAARTDGGLKTATGQILGSTWEMQTAAGGSVGGGYHGYGGELPLSPWIPQVYRRVLAGAGVN